MRFSPALRRLFGLLAVAALPIMVSVPMLAVTQAAPDAPAFSGSAVDIQLPGRHIHANAPTVALRSGADLAQVSLSFTLSNTGNRSFDLQPADFALSAEGDIFGPASASSQASALSGAVPPTGARSGALVFLLPAAALTRASLLYHPSRDHIATSAPLHIAAGQVTTSQASGSSAGPLVQTSAGAMSLASASANEFEDTFVRANQTGWGTSTNVDGVPNFSWSGAGSGNSSFVTINSNRGLYGYPGATNIVGIAVVRAVVQSGGDSLVRFSVSAVGHVIPYVVENACADDTCYYGARLQTAANRLEIGRRNNGSTSILASVAFTPHANTVYWMRLDVVRGASNTLRAKIWANGTTEPGWMVTATDTAPLPANLDGTGGSWTLVGTGETIAYTCYAYSATTLATACGAGSSSTPTPTPTTAPTATPTSVATATPTTAPTATPTTAPTATPIPQTGTIKTYQLGGGVGLTWGTAIDGAGNVWFAEPGCDFAPTCSSSAPPGQIGELPAGSTTPRFFKLPSITGNQPNFVALDSGGHVWFTTPDNSMIGEFDPSTQAFVGQWAVTNGSGPWDLTINKGIIWYTEHFAAAVGRFDPVAHTHTDIATPSASSAPYGIVGNDPVNSNLIWFTENNSTVARIAVVDTGNSNHVSEYVIRSQLPGGLTPHMITLDAQGHPWWTEGFAHAIGVLNPSQATPGQCGTSSGDCLGVTEQTLPPPPATCSGSHVSGIAIRGSSPVWVTDSLSAEVLSYSPSTRQWGVHVLSNCNAHPHDGLNLDPALHPWWDEEFANALGELT